ncbi:MAG: hypothetical protein ACRDQB_08485, partial [Thermocrispum sp.]
HGEPPLDPRDAAVLAGAVREIAAAVRDERPPVKPELPDDPRLAAVAVDLNALYDALRAPDLTQGRVRRRRRAARRRRSPR